MCSCCKQSSYNQNRSQLVASFPSKMKLIRVAAFILLVLLVTTPEESEGAIHIPIIWFLKVAVKLGVKKLVKNAHYARCKIRRVRGLRCPRKVYGMGMNSRQAQNAARFFATRRDRRCGNYLRCKIHRFRG